MKVEINDIHIREAEHIFIDGNEFDKKERIPFIKNLQTSDLLAVPGSGKTTALMAKLYCLSKQLPFNDGSGILVLAHTNSTVNEIEKELKKHCPNLFQYPNFIGTVQSFVNKFLANPANFLKYDSYIAKNDDDIYKKEVADFFNYKLKWKQNGDTFPKLKNLLYGKANHNRTNLSPNEKNENTIDFIFYLKFDLISRKILYGEKSKTLYKFDGTAKDHYLEIENWKESLFRNGILSYRDSFSLANWYLHNFPNVREQLQHRFKYVFIDEMQDLEEYQIDIIDNIFFTEKSKTIIQRIGDPNQSIYNRVKDECDWKPRNASYLNGSNRLSSKNAELVNYFTFRNEEEKFNVVGERKLLQNEKEINPHLVLFTKETKERLKIKFEEIIKSHNLHNIEEKKKGFKIIGWTGERTNESDGNLCLHTVFGYNKLSKSKKEDFDSLSKYLQLFDQEKETLEGVRKSILNALITILRFEDKKLVKIIRGRTVERFYTKSDLIEYIKACSNNGIYEDFKAKLFDWCFDLVSTKNYRLVFNSVKKFIENEFKEWFDLELNRKTQFFIFEFNDEMRIKNKKIVEDNLGIEVTTVHAVKGQTHCATMYVETAYKKPIYETLKLKEASLNTSIKKQKLKTIPLYKQKQSCETPTGIEALKMMYVGFSRPTHLLCFAVLEENVKDDLDKYRNSDWIINSDLVKK
ncbi:DNA-dependent helicase II [Flavobacterium sp. ACN2]|uniref:UvrD-helicase domain-containing protein n=1 Tax=unclassified Flavobacterium TaxID=196869 RepID=UPI001557E3EB|nr:MULTISPECIES: UvrD-helicase domain-containing protein [unclassified Flavobacterium]MDY0986093.1 UvrD-helicase domain-containing protein [Flavobacterium sp. CFBP9031]PBI90835.1 DNA-dependent helicase II [Flavobacterium sp. ACN2]